MAGTIESSRGIGGLPWLLFKAWSITSYHLDHHHIQSQERANSAAKKGQQQPNLDNSDPSQFKLPHTFISFQLLSSLHRVRPLVNDQPRTFESPAPGLFVSACLLPQTTPLSHSTTCQAPSTKRTARRRTTSSQPTKLRR